MSLSGVNKFIGEHNVPSLMLASFVWMLGMYYFITGQKMYLAVFVPIGNLMFYYGVYVRVFGPYKYYVEDSDQDMFSMLSVYKYKFFTWVFGVLLFVYMPFSNIHTYNKISEHLVWNETKNKLDAYPLLDSIYGEKRKYSYPEWLFRDSAIRIAKVHAGGEIAYGSFVYMQDVGGELIKVDSLVAGK